MGEPAMTEHIPGASAEQDRDNIDVRRDRAPDPERQQPAWNGSRGEGGEKCGRRYAVGKNGGHDLTDTG